MKETDTAETAKATRRDTQPKRPGGTEDVVRRLGLSGGAVLRKLVLSGRFPAPDESGIYDASLVDAWARANTSWLAAPNGPARRKIRVIWPAEGIEEIMSKETEETEGMEETEETEELADEEALQDAQDAPEGAGEGLPLESISAVREIALEAIRTIRELSGLAEQEGQEEQEEDGE